VEFQILQKILNEWVVEATRREAFVSEIDKMDSTKHDYLIMNIIPVYNK
jgi:hypothetical protein